jgi:hypothetical protein
VKILDSFTRSRAVDIGGLKGAREKRSIKTDSRYVGC